MFYTYIHIRTQTNEIFYVGKGCNDRHSISHGRSKRWKQFTKDCEWHSEIVSYWDTEDEAYAHEKLLIGIFRDMNLKLANVSSGGSLYEKDGNVSKPVVCIDTNMTFKSCTEASLWLASIGHIRSNRSIVSRGCRLGRKVYGLAFAYVEPYEIPKPSKKRVRVGSSNTGEPHISWVATGNTYMVYFSKNKITKYFTVANHGTKKAAFESAIKFKYSVYDNVLNHIANKDEHFPNKDKYE